VRDSSKRRCLAKGDQLWRMDKLGEVDEGRGVEGEYRCGVRQQLYCYPNFELKASTVYMGSYSCITDRGLCKDHMPCLSQLKKQLLGRNSGSPEKREHGGPSCGGTKDGVDSSNYLTWSEVPISNDSSSTSSIITVWRGKIENTSRTLKQTAPLAL
jgi:hypothetical protein